MNSEVTKVPADTRGLLLTVDAGNGLTDVTVEIDALKRTVNQWLEDCGLPHVKVLLLHGIKATVLR